MGRLVLLPSVPASAAAPASASSLNFRAALSLWARSYPQATAAAAAAAASGRHGAAPRIACRRAQRGRGVHAASARDNSELLARLELEIAGEESRGTGVPHSDSPRNTAAAAARRGGGEGSSNNNGASAIQNAKQGDRSSNSSNSGGRGGLMSSSPNSFNGVFLLLLLNVAAFFADHVLRLPVMPWLYLHHGSARWYQFVTSTFCHASWNHLSSNLFFLYIFGRLVEEEEGSGGLWATYLVTGAGSNLVSWLLLPASVVSVGASGAVFGLFAVSVLTRVRFNWRKLLEALILGQFVVERLIFEAQSSQIMGVGGAIVSGGVNHVAHLAGALMGALLIWLVSRLPDPQTSSE